MRLRSETKHPKDQRCRSNSTASGRAVNRPDFHEISEDLRKNGGLASRRREVRCVRMPEAGHVWVWQILLQKSFWGGEGKFLQPLMRFARGDVRDHIVSFKIDHGPP
jgi:hypothetical protein